MVGEGKGGGWALAILAGEVWQFRRLLGALAGRAVRARYAASLLGFLWAVLEPLLQFGLYVVVFGFFLGLRGFAGGGWGFALWLLGGLVPFLLVQEGWVRAATALRSHGSLVKHVPVPLSVLLGAELGAVLARHSLLWLCWLFWAGSTGAVSLAGLTWWALGALATLLLLLGGGLWLSAAGVYIPDVGPAAGAAFGFLLYLTPVLYPESVVPAGLRAFLWLNPFYGVVNSLRGLLGSPVSPRALAFSLVVGVGLLVSGAAVFARRADAMRDLV